MRILTILISYMFIVCNSFALDIATHIEVENTDELYKAFESKDDGIINIYIKRGNYILDKPIRINGGKVRIIGEKGTYLYRNFPKGFPTITYKNSFQKKGTVLSGIKYELGKDADAATYRYDYEGEYSIDPGSSIAIKSKTNGITFARFLGFKDEQMLVEHLSQHDVTKGDEVYFVPDNLFEIIDVNIGIKRPENNSFGNEYTSESYLWRITDHGIYISNATDVLIDNIVLMDHKFAINIEDSDSVTVRRSRFDYNFNSIFLVSSTNIVVESNTITNSYRTGMLLSNVTDASILSNNIDSTALFQNKGGDAITIGGSNNILVSSNRIVRSGCYGIWPTSGSNNIIITNNIIAYGITGACYLGSSATGEGKDVSFVKVLGNLFNGNSYPVHTIGNSHNIEVSNNISTDRKVTPQFNKDHKENMILYRNNTVK